MKKVNAAPHGSKVSQRSTVVPQRDEDHPTGLLVNWHHACVAGPAFMALYLKNRSLTVKAVADRLRGLAHLMAEELGENAPVRESFEVMLEAIVIDRDERIARMHLDEVFKKMYEAAPEDFDWSKAG